MFYQKEIGKDDYQLTVFDQELSDNDYEKYDVKIFQCLIQEQMEQSPILHSFMEYMMSQECFPYDEHDYLVNNKELNWVRLQRKYFSKYGTNLGFEELISKDVIVDDVEKKVYIMLVHNLKTRV